jgi:hypothetical protein
VSSETAKRGSEREVRELTEGKDRGGGNVVIDFERWAELDCETVDEKWIGVRGMRGMSCERCVEHDPEAVADEGDDCHCLELPI